MTIPPLLVPGDDVLVISPSSHPTSDRWIQGIEVLEAWGLRVNRGKNYLAVHEGFAGTDAERLADFQAGLDDPSMKAIFPMRGGYGASRLLDSLDFSGMKRSPKWLVGFSDITAPLVHLDSLGFAGIHGPMPHNFCVEGGELALESLYRLLFHGETYLEANASPYNRLGEATGKAIGGNLSILVHLLGSSSFENPAGKILCLEEVGERLYHVDRMLVQLKRAGFLQNLAGLLVGGFTDCHEAPLTIGKKYEEIIREHTEGTSYPIAFDVPFGHIPSNFALPFGTKINLSINSEKVQVTGQI
jgi:muramoyltetrapeptide carboxypeptidase